MNPLEQWQQLKHYFLLMRMGKPVLVPGARVKEGWLAPPPKDLDPDAVALWTGLGLKRCVEAGLLAALQAEGAGSIEALLIFSGIKVYAQDEHRVFCPPDQVRVVRKMPVEELLRGLGLTGIA
ncbi:MAG: hypothetical protein IT285_14795 [Bdellovibrionales bacterium]|nr:hypothetical protein [Bdellovibrionales bacterium]